MIEGVAILTFVLTVCAIVLAALYDTDPVSRHLRENLTRLEDEIDNLVADPDYDLPTYEGKAIRERVEELDRKAQATRKILDNCHEH